MSADQSRPQNIIVLGALSTIAEALARRLAAEGAQFVLAARHPERLAQLAEDLKGRGSPKAVVWAAELAGVDDVPGEFKKMVAALGGEVDAVLVFYGMLGDQRRAEADNAELRRILAVNFGSTAEWCVAAAGQLSEQKRGLLLAISSVAGDRGRQSNYAYGAAKAGLTVLMEGLAHRLAPTGAQAVVVKLGFVDTAMTAHIAKGGPLWAKPDHIAASLQKIMKRPSKPVVYMPWFWRPIMAVVRRVPSAIFHKTKL